MPIPVQQTPPATNYHGIVVGEPVSGTTGLALDALQAHVAGFAYSQPIASLFAPNGATELHAVFKRRAQTKVLRIEVEPARGASETSTTTVTVTGIGAWIDAGGLDGSRAIPATNRVLLTMPRVVGWADVSGITADTLTLITISATGNGVSRVAIHESPLAALDPVGSPSTEHGFDPAWPAGSGPRNTLHQGTTAAARGILRCIAQDKALRQQWYRHAQINGPWSTTSGTFANITAALRFRPRSTYAGASDRYHACVVYRTTDGTTAGEAQCTITAGSTATIALPASTTWTIVSDYVTASTPAALATAKWAIRRTAGTGVVQVSTVALVGAPL